MGRPGGNPDIIKITKNTRFSKEYQPKKSGFAKEMLKAFKKASKWTKKDIATFVKNILLEYTFEEIQELIKNKKLPAFIWGACAAFLKDISRGNARVLQWMIELAYGKEETLIVKDGEEDITQLSRDEMLKRLKERSKEIEEVLKGEEDGETKEIKGK